MLMTAIAFAMGFQQVVGGGQSAQPVEEKPLFAIGGPDGRFERPGITLIRDNESWAAWWAKLKGLKPPLWGPNEPPSVNLEVLNLVGVASDPGMNSNGIRFVSVTQGNGATVLRYAEAAYQTEGPGGGGVKCNSWGVVAFYAPKPNSLYPKPKVIVEQNVQSVIGQPPVWKQRAEFDVTAP